MLLKRLKQKEIITMSKKESFLYFQMAHLLDAGFTMSNALDSLEKQSPRKLRKKLITVQHYLEKGQFPWEAFKMAGFGKMEVALLRASERSGDLPGCFRQLAEDAERRTQFNQKILSGLAYPMFLLLVSPLLLSLPMMFKDGPGAFATTVFTYYGSLVAGVLALVFAHRFASLSMSYHSILNNLPILGKLRFRMAFYRFYSTASALLSAGILMDETWELSSEASSNPIYSRLMKHVIPRVIAGNSLHEELARLRFLPDVHIQCIKTGEVSGKLPDTMKTLAKMCLEDAQAQMSIIAKLLPAVIYLAVAGKVASEVIGFYQGYFSQLNQF